MRQTSSSFVRRRRRLLAPILLAAPLTLASLGGCRIGKNARGFDTDSQAGPTPFVPLPLKASEVGPLMTTLDKALKAWQHAMSSGNSQMARRMAMILRNETNDSFDEVIQGLESPAPAIRQTAAAAVGFSGREEALSALSNALSDPDSKVLANALIGLGQLADPSSPVAIIAYHLRSSSDPLVRSNAAFALGQVVANGGADETVVREACRQGLYDDFAGVRSQCAVVLGRLKDEDALPDLAVLIEDPEDLAAKPAILALGEIARSNPRLLGEVSRALVDALGKVRRGRKQWIHAELVRVSGRDLEDDTNAWRNWAYALP